MDIKTRLKERLLEIPFRSKAYRETHKLAEDLNVHVEDVQTLLNELVNKKILKEKIQYICPTCSDTTIMDNQLLKEFLDEDNCFSCDNCMSLINPATDKTGFIYYDVEDEVALANY